MNFSRVTIPRGVISRPGFLRLIICATIFFSSASVITGGQPESHWAEPFWTVEGDSYRNLGLSLAQGIDANGDSAGDLVVGAPSSTNDGQTNEGAVLIYYQDDGQLFKLPSWVIYSNEVGAGLGASVAAGGNTNGDAFGDLLIGAPTSDVGGLFNAGRAVAHLGTLNGPAVPAHWVFLGAGNQDNTGHSVAMLGDINGDGFGDVLIGSPYHTNENTAEGKADLFYGSSNGLSTTPTWTAEGDRNNAKYGFAVTRLGDVNGDGFADAAISSPTYEPSSRGRVFVYYGSNAGFSQTSNWSYADLTGVEFGYSLAGADVNGDGFSDLVVGAPSHSVNQQEQGRIFVFYGSSNGLSATVSWSTAGIDSHGNLGYAIASAGDVNSDGFQDIIASAYIHGVEPFRPGAAFVYFGSQLGLLKNPVINMLGEQDMTYFGRAVSGGSDLNGDGYDDIAVGCPEYTNGQQGEGKVYVFAGGPIYPVFLDGFETGDTTLWSLAFP